MFAEDVRSDMGVAAKILHLGKYVGLLFRVDMGGHGKQKYAKTDSSITRVGR